jgi:hypothetical protein
MFDNIAASSKLSIKTFPRLLLSALSNKISTRSVKMAIGSSFAGIFSPEKLDGVLALIGGFSLHLTLGTLYCFGNLVAVL